MIKNFLEFVKESKNIYDFGCVLLRLKLDNWNDVTSIIDDEDLYKPEDPSFGLEKSPHITVFYGLHSDINHEKVEDCIQKWKDKDFEISVDKIDFFENEEFDVIKFSVDCNDNLKKFNSDLSKFPNSNRFKDYKPHITIAYLKKGVLDKYKGIRKKIDFKLKDIEYSQPNGSKKYFKIESEI